MSPDISPKWYKFDDGEVAECKMDDDEVLSVLVQFFVCSLSINLQGFYHKCHPLIGFTTHCQFSGRYIVGSLAVCSC